MGSWVGTAGLPLCVKQLVRPLRKPWASVGFSRQLPFRRQFVYSFSVNRSFLQERIVVCKGASGLPVPSKDVKHPSVPRGLNEEQAAAVRTESNCVRVMAGPGSGKTLVLTYRIAHLIKTRGVNASNMLCITFTNKAANELRERLRKLLGKELCAQLTIGTFHGICARILRDSASKDVVGVDKDFVIYDEQDAERIIKTLLREENFGETKTAKKKQKPTAIPSKDVQETMELVSGLKLLMLKNFVLKRSNSSQVLKLPVNFARIEHLASRYQKDLRSNNAVDFDDLIGLTVRLFFLKSDVWEKYQRRWSYVLADEFQDTDVAQYIFVRKLCLKNQNLFVVGDVDQAIYGWRGADYKNMHNLQRHFSELTTLELRRNYRSSSNILSLASEIIKPTSRILDKPTSLEAVKPVGLPVKFFEFDDPKEEAGYVCSKIRDMVSERQLMYKDVGILYRTKNQGQSFEKVLIENNVPYSVGGAMSLLSYKEIKDLRAYLQLVWNREDGIALERVMNTPPRGLGPTTLRMIRDWALERNLTLPQAFQKIDADRPSHSALKITKKARESILEFCDLVKVLEELCSVNDCTAGRIVQEVLDRTKIVEYLKASPEGEKRVQRIEEFKALAQKYGCGREALGTFLESIALASDAEETGQDGATLNTVKLSTLHAAKGLEFDTVFISGLEEGIIPHVRGDIDEERRLFYVGVTRAKHQLFLTYRRQALLFDDGLRRNRLSSFLRLPSNLFEEERPDTGYVWGGKQSSSILGYAGSANGTE